MFFKNFQGKKQEAVDCFNLLQRLWVESKEKIRKDPDAASFSSTPSATSLADSDDGGNFIYELTYFKKK
jgi:hypothetical protein